MITTVTLNAAIDKTYYIPNFPLGQVSRVRQMYAEPGGKGINVARVIQQLGYPVLASGIIGGHNGRFIEQKLDAQGIKHDFVQIEEESRLCLNMIDESNGSSTEVLEQGPWISAETWQLFQAKLAGLAAQSRIVCFSGSLPQGVPTDGYAQLIRIVKQAGALAFLDTSGTALLQGVGAQPDFVKPNEDEVTTVLGAFNEGNAEDQPDIDRAEGLLRLQQQGIPRVTVSLGAAGSISAYEGALYRVQGPPIQVVNTVGCGDSFVAGMAMATAQNLTFPTCLQYASAVASANALTERAGYVHLHDVERLQTEITVELV
ncbi:1-phosphofructokinase family hexose kinase [Paenibacillus sp. WQ 127069]|uniref:Tagatose-6-phosphate kinase n=1 Tax=Paenibacillus baimaensis TaxID=2982185 RepID=A0ABT2UKC5_9BACL|nr:1-phosphofructokinase family hexose kinase [Paenibacillus sp. WQ 127069]MCU6795092.1 1-phosphofructokinase family hexose kinase [Paenibacillus sp. WQ 127069]